MSIMGREPPADIVVPAPQVSARHAEIRHLGGDRYLLTDLDSSNGTYVNGSRIKCAEVVITDRVSLGSFEISLAGFRHLIPHVAQPAAVPSPAAPQQPVYQQSDAQIPAPSAALKLPAAPPMPAPPAEKPPHQASGKGGWKSCPSCGSDQVMSIEVFNQKNPKEMKVKGGGMSGCIGCLLCLLLVILLWPVLLVLGVVGGAAGAVGIFGITRIIQENPVPIAIFAVLIIGAIIAVQVMKPKYICERCGKKF